MNTSSFLKTCLSGLALSVALGACSSNSLSSPTPSPSVKQTQMAKKPIVLSYKKGQRLTLATIEGKAGDDAKKAVAEYYKDVFPVAREKGLKRDAQLKVLAAPQGNHKPGALAVFSWPDPSAEQAFQDALDWQRVKDIRKSAWDELRLYSTTLEEDLNLNFHPDKTYTLAVAWKNPKNPNDYDQYMDNIKDGVAELGGRFIYKMFDPTFESHALQADAPYQLTFVEWDTADGLQKFGKSKTFKQNAKLIGTGVTRFELMVLKPQ